MSAATRISIVLAAGIVCLAATASTALGQEPGYNLDLSMPSTVTVEQTTIIQASGSNPPDDFFSSWLDISAIPTSVLAACPADYLNANQIARSSSAQGGEVVINSQREDVDDAGNFSMPVAYTPQITGRFLICGYTNDGATTTLATSSRVVRVSTPGDSKAKKRAKAIKRCKRKFRKKSQRKKRAACVKRAKRKYPVKG